MTADGKLAEGLPATRVVGLANDPHRLRDELDGARIISRAEAELGSYLARPGHLLTAAERRVCEEQPDALLLECAASDSSPRAGLTAAATWIERLVALGAEAILLPATRRIVGREALLGSLLPALTSSDGWLTLFVQQVAISDGAWVWYHTHGLEHFGLPDLEVRVAEAERAAAERLIQAAIDHQLTGGSLTPGALGEAVDDGGAAPPLRFLVHPARAVEGHGYGPLGAVQIVPVIT